MGRSDRRTSDALARVLIYRPRESRCLQCCLPVGEHVIVDFRFDDSKSFAENGEAFLEALEYDAPEMADILRDNWDALVAIVREGDRDLGARSNFNTKVALALDALAQSVERMDSA